MSLIHWWPLNGDTKDYGLNGVDLTNSNVTFANNGKIGQAAVFDDDSDKLSCTNGVAELHALTKYSMCCWIYLTAQATNHSSSFLSSGNWNSGSAQICFGLYNWNSGYGTLLVPNGSYWGNGITLTNKIQLNVWHHFTIVYDGSTTKGYIDGVYVGSFNGGGISTTENASYYLGAATYYSGFTMKGRMNDFRIYDHALSLKEVKEISKGLILHYNFEDEYIEATTNLFAGRTDFSNTSHWPRNQINSIAPTVDSEGNMKLYGYATDGNHQSYTFSKNAGYTSISASTTYTLSIWVKYSSTSAYFNMYFYEQNSSGTSVKNNMWRMGCTADEVGHWVLRSKTVTTQSTTARMYTELNCYNCPSTEYIIMKNNSLQLEQKDHATPFVNGTRSVGKVYDNSGYGFNSKVVNNIAIVNDSISGSRCAVFDGSSSYVEASGPYLNGASEFTFSIWCKPTTTSVLGLVSLEKSTTWRVSASTSPNTIRLRDNSGDNSYKEISMGSYTANTPALFTITYKNGTATTYKNGVQVATVAVGGTTMNTDQNYLMFGKNVQNSNYYNGRIGDVKIFSTALSANDILAEYQIKASIDKNGNLFASEFVEDYDNINITKTGVVKTSRFEEGTDLVKFNEKYTELEYIQSDKNQWINTNYYPKLDKTKVVADAVKDVGYSIFGSDSSFFTYTGSATHYSYYNGSQTNTATTYHDRHLYIMDKNKTYIDDVLYGTKTLVSSTATKPLGIFGRITSTSPMTCGDRGAHTLYSLMIYEDDVLIHYYLPCRRKSDNEIGLYDIINRQFYTNQGTGTFVAGPEVGTLSLIYANQIIEN